MFDLDASKIVIVGVAALIFIPPKDLPRVMRQVGQFVGKMRRMANEFQGQFMDAMREADMADLRAEARKLSDAARIETGLGTVRDLDKHLLDQPMRDQPMRPLATQPAPDAVETTTAPATSGVTAAATRPEAAPAPAPEPQHPA